MDPVFSGPNVQNSLAMADPLAVLVLLGAVAAAASLSVTEGINTCMDEVSGGQPPKADDVVTAWLDNLLMPPLNR
jgi:uracil-DNA glycosylase